MGYTEDWEVLCYRYWIKFALVKWCSLHLDIYLLCLLFWYLYININVCTAEHSIHVVPSIYTCTNLLPEGKLLLLKYMLNVYKHIQLYMTVLHRKLCIFKSIIFNILGRCFKKFYRSKNIVFSLLAL